jgi:hypothetical protein
MTNDEYTIERKVEYMTDRLDRRYMNGELSDCEYQEQIKAIDIWAESEYAMLAGIAVEL